MMNSLLGAFQTQSFVGQTMRSGLSSLSSLSPDDLVTTANSLSSYSALQTGIIDSLHITDPLKYWFMFPTAVCVATLAVTAGIGGAALFGPFLLIVLPAIGPSYPLTSATTAVATAILTETFGFSSGLYGYFRRGLIDVGMAAKIAAISVPAAIIAAKYLTLDPLLLKCCYTVLMLSLAGYLLVGGESSENVSTRGESSTDITSETELIQKVDKAGELYEYPVFNLSSFGSILTVVAGALTGILGVGIGEVTTPQFLRKGIPVSVAAATSTLVVTSTALSSAIVQVINLTSKTGDFLPVNMLMYMLPGVVVGGQVATKMQGKINQAELERGIGLLFGFIGIAFTALITKQVTGA